MFTSVRRNLVYVIACSNLHSENIQPYMWLYKAMWRDPLRPCPARGGLAATTKIDAPCSGTRTTTLGAMSDQMPDDGDDVELESLEADLAVIEAAMEKADAGDLDGYEEVIAGLGDAPPEPGPSEQVGDGAVGDEFDAGPEGQPAV